MNEEPHPVTIFSGTAWEAALLKSLLDNAEIDAYLKDEIRGYMAPWHVSPGGTDPVKILVSSVDAAKARIVVDDFKAKQQSE